MRLLTSLLVLASLAGACDSNKPEPSPTRPTPSERAAAGPFDRLPAPARLLALGDVHGDLSATRAALELAGLIDAGGRWSGGDAVLVQTGDILDRGDDEQAILDLFERLQGEAKAAGGAVHILNGNHELMNANGDFRYVIAGGFRDFEDVAGLSLTDPALAGAPEGQRARLAAFRPGGVYAKKLAAHPVVLVVGDSVFAHGGVTPKYARYGLDKINREVADWLLGKGARGRWVVNTPDSPVWSRHFSDEPDESDCRMLQESLEALKVARMVVGHTVQKTISAACGESVWRIDVGMAAHYGGHPEVLEITGGRVRPLR